MHNKIKSEIHELKLLLRSVPGSLLSFFILSVIVMNLLANKSITLPFDWLALDCGILVSWISFLSMDIITKHFGPKAATEISILAVVINLFACLVFFLASIIPGLWGESFVEGSEELLNTALNHTFGGTWYVLFGSTVAFTVSAVINNFANYGIGKWFSKNPDSPAAYVCRTYLSTALGQFADNLVFAFIVSHFFFGWSFLQCLTCALTGMVAELLCEVLFSHLGYRVCKSWKRDGVGEAYFAYRKEKKLEEQTI